MVYRGPNSAMVLCLYSTFVFVTTTTLTSASSLALETWQPASSWIWSTTSLAFCALVVAFFLFFSKREDLMSKKIDRGSFVWVFVHSFVIVVVVVIIVFCFLLLFEAPFYKTKFTPFGANVQLDDERVRVRLRYIGVGLMYFINIFSCLVRRLSQPQPNIVFVYSCGGGGCYIQQPLIVVYRLLGYS